MKKAATVLMAGAAIGASIMWALYSTVWVNYTAVTLSPDGGHYVGPKKNGLFHGKGKITWTDGVEYEGDFYEGLITGNGKITYADGSNYDGAFLNGLMHGEGVLVYENTRYEGELKNDLFDGKGVYLMEDGSKYSGHFVKGEFHGSGTYENDYGKYEGEFDKGVFTGKGKYTSNEGAQYTGEFVDWVYQGQGTLTGGNGDQYIGKFEGGSLNGPGEFIGHKGDRYEGSFSNGYYHGQGAYRAISGDVYEGGFEYGLYKGRGTLTYAQPLDGVTSLSGVWRNGSLAKPDNPDAYKTTEMITEAVLYNQNRLLENSINNIQQESSDAIDMYFLGVAGYGSEAVFRREVLYIKDYFDRNLDTDGKSMVLINDRQTIDEYPLATRTSIKMSLESIAEKMDKQNDILFVYLSSHGSEDHELSLNQPGLKVADISAEAIADTIKSIPIAWKVIVISACYSGGFVPYLEDEKTLVITAAAKDKTSFGCKDENEFTYFGEALFKDALPASDSFASAFEKAREIVKKRETDEDYTFSDPQISKPDAILKHLQEWRAQQANRSGLSGR